MQRRLAVLVTAGLIASCSHQPSPGTERPARPPTAAVDASEPELADAEASPSSSPGTDVAATHATGAARDAVADDATGEGSPIDTSGEPSPDSTGASPAATSMAPLALDGLPTSKLGLVAAVESALRAGDARALGSLWLDGTTLGAACAAAPEDVARQDEHRREGATAFAECLALADWKAARRLVLNLGHTQNDYVPGCANPRRLESSEAFYAVGDRVFKVKLHDPVALDGKVALGARLRCTAKGGSAAKLEKQLLHFGRRCPKSGWPALTQTGPSCPTR